MGDLPIEKLHALVEAHGRSVCDDPRCREAPLRDVCGSYKKEIHVLISALNAHVPWDLLEGSGGAPSEVLHERLTYCSQLKAVQGRLISRLMVEVSLLDAMMTRWNIGQSRPSESVWLPYNFLITAVAVPLLA